MKKTKTSKDAKLNSTIIYEGGCHPKSAKGEHYVDNEKMFGVLSGWLESVNEAEANGTKPPRIPEYLGECILKIASRVANHPSFNRYTFKDEMISKAVENCVVKIRKFDPKKSSNPFAYFTQTCVFIFIGMISSEAKYRYHKYKMIAERLSTGELFDCPEQMSEAAEHILDNQELQQDYLESFIKDYEARAAAKKLAAKTPVVELFDVPPEAGGEVA